MHKTLIEGKTLQLLGRRSRSKFFSQEMQRAEKLIVPQYDGKATASHGECDVEWDDEEVEGMSCTGCSKSIFEGLYVLRDINRFSKFD